MDERQFENAEHMKLRTLLSGKWFLFSGVALFVLLGANGIYNIVRLILDINSHFLLFMPFFSILIEGFREAIIIFFMIGVIRLVVKSRKTGRLDSGCIERIVKALVIGAVSFTLIYMVLFFQFYLTNFVQGIILLLVVIGSFLLFIVYLSKVNTLPFDNDKAIPNPTAPMIWLVAAFAFLVFHFHYMSSGGTYSIYAARGFFFLNMSFVKYIILLLLDLVVINLLMGLYGATKENGRRYRLATYAAATLTVIAISLGVVTESSEAVYLVNQYENTSDSVRDFSVMLETRDSLIFAVGTSYSGQSWTNSTYTFYDFGFASQIDLYHDQDKLPSITSSPTMNLIIPDTANLYDIIVYDGEFNIVDRVESWEDLSLLTEGSYIVKLYVHNKVNYSSVNEYFLFTLNVE